MPDHYQPMPSLRRQAGELLIDAYWNDRDGLEIAADGAATLYAADELGCDEFKGVQPMYQLCWERWRYDQWCNEMNLRHRYKSVNDTEVTYFFGTSYLPSSCYTPKYLPVGPEDTLL